MVFEPLSTTPWWIGPNLYMWLLWFEPLPAFRNENKPAIKRLDLWWVTVNGPPNMAHASPWKPWQLQKYTESYIEKCLPKSVP